MMYKFIKDLQTSKNFTDQTILNLYMPVIMVDNAPIYITTTNRYKTKNLTKNPNTYTYTEDVNDACTFKYKEDVETIIELQGHDFTIVQFKDLFTKAYTIHLGENKNESEKKIFIQTSWKPHNYTSEERNLITTTDYDLAKTKLANYKFRLVKHLQDKIMALASISLD